MGRQGIAELILALQPEMRELLHLREEVVRLRNKVNPPTPTLAALMEGGPITVRRDDDGRWSATIDTGSGSTGVSGCETDVVAFKQAVSHVAHLLGTEWSREDDE
jgi:hypothetical protein